MATESPVVTELKKNLTQVDVDGTKLWLAEGDLLLDDEALAEYARNGRANAPPPPAASPFELLATTDAAGRIYRWKPGLELGYCVRKATFKANEYAEVVQDLMRATQDWEATCGVKFRHKAAQDEAEQPDGILFSVRKLDSFGEFIAAAFFPEQPQARRHVLIDPTYFTTTFRRVGVLTHELGHVLGFRHEHIKSGAPPDCPKESTANTAVLGPYDPTSVMHYFCGNVGSKDLRITENDVIASQRLYGPPLDKGRITLP